MLGRASHGFVPILLQMTLQKDSPGFEPKLFWEQLTPRCIRLVWWSTLIQSAHEVQDNIFT